MSFILEALKRADAERERGEVPGLHAQALPSAVAEGEPAQRIAMPMRWIAGAVVLLLAGALGWALLARDEAPAASRPVAGGPAAPVVPVVAVPAPVRPAAASAAVELVLPPPAPREVEPPPRRAATSTATAASVPVATASPDVSATGKSTTAAQLAASAAARPASEPVVEGRIFTVAELPADVRRELPQLVFGGSMYSADPARRMLIVNTLIFRENDTLAPGLTVEQIRPKGAVLKFKGYRYEVGY